MTTEFALAVEHLSVSFKTEHERVAVVQDVSFVVRAGETLALVGESGSGKSVTSLALLRLTPPPPRSWVQGRVHLLRRNGTVEELTKLSDEAMRDIRGNEIAMIFQEPMSSLNPVHTIGDQIIEAIAVHQKNGRKKALERTLELLDLVGIPEPRKRLHSYPHHLSGGMRQRVMIAIALACHPTVLIADEPTTALDVTVQAQILELLKDLQARTGMAIIFITHNMGVVAELADRVMVMYAGRIVEQADCVELFSAPRMPYTRGLLQSVPRMDRIGQGAVLQAIPGAVPDPTHLPGGCAFHPRCAQADPHRCMQEVPELADSGTGHWVRCVRWHEL